MGTVVGGGGVGPSDSTEGWMNGGADLIVEFIRSETIRYAAVV